MSDICLVRKTDPVAVSQQERDLSVLLEALFSANVDEALKRIETLSGKVEINTCPNCHKPIDDTQMLCDDCAWLPIEPVESDGDEQ